MADILFELGCEELPPKALYGLSQALYQGVCKQLTAAGFTWDEGASRWYASPRRLAFQLFGINEQLADQTTEKRGPSVAAAYDDKGNAKPAAMGFARSVGAEVSDLTTIQTDKGEYLSYTVLEKGQSIAEVLPEFIVQSIKQLPIPKPMRWGNNDYSFIRPVHWMVLLQDETVIPMELFGLSTNNQTLGHRFHHNRYDTIGHAQDYVQVLQAAQIMVDQGAREDLIAEQVKTAASSVNGVAKIDPALLSEVASITEKPSAVLGEFSTDFLAVPKEALISSMEKHQKYFPMEDDEGQLMPYFVALANIDSSNPAAVKKGFEKVITPRLADARFFWEKDKARPLADNIPLLEKMVFEKSLGTLADKTSRISQLLTWMAPQLGFDEASAQRAAELMKSDLMSDMVDEFPDLQGLMGGYYATAQGEPDAVAKAIRDQYLPKFVGDKLPETTLGQAVSVADKMDTLCGIFAVGKKPTGSKDPFALRRAALSVISILRDKKLDIIPEELIDQAAENLPVDNTTSNHEVKEFFYERLKNSYQDDGVSYDVFNAVYAQDSGQAMTLADFEQRIQATVEFKVKPYAKSLIEAGKRSYNITNKLEGARLVGDIPDYINMPIDPALFNVEIKAEERLYEAYQSVKAKFEELTERAQYTEGYELLSGLAEPLDQYFEDVMVMVDDEAVKLNRLAQLYKISRLTRSIADLSELVKK